MYGTKSAEAQSSFDDVILFARVVSSGSITINEDSSVQILAEEACSVDQLDAQVRSTETHVQFRNTDGTFSKDASRFFWLQKVDCNMRLQQYCVVHS